MAYSCLAIRVGTSAAFVLAVACGGSTVSGEGGSGNEAGAGDTGTQHDSAGDSPSLRDGKAPDAVTTVDTGTTTTDSGPFIDSGATGTVNCGTGLTCNAPAQVCCATEGAGGGGGGGGGDAAGVGTSCVAAGSCNNGLAIACEGSSNCTGGNVCCLAESGGGAATTCQASCGEMSIQLCDMDSDCPTGETCRQTEMLGGIGTCREPHGDGGFHVHDGGFVGHDGGFTGPKPDSGTVTADAG